MIEFNEPLYVERSLGYIQEAIRSNHICGDGYFTKKCSGWIEKKTKTAKCLFTTSCTHALEMAAFLSNIQEGDEVLMPSYTFASTADAFALRGARLVFVDIRPDTMNIDEKLIESAITDKTKAIVVVHYAGVSCEMDTIMEIADKHKLIVIEDAAQGIMSSYKGQALGTIGDFGCFSFHETKNYSMGEGGALLLKDRSCIERAEILREKGTNRSKFYRGEVDKYSWVGIGSSYLPSELNMAYLWGQLEEAEDINCHRLALWNKYYELLSPLFHKGMLEAPVVPKNCIHNAHMFYIKVRDEDERIRLIHFLKENQIHAVFHYIPLHSAPSGIKYGRFAGKDIYTTKESLRILRLPMHNKLTEDQVEYVCEKIFEFYKSLKGMIG
ncbi:MAG: dTDP-4-amino-4,6-dideoxygalactose transaminase [Roseburia sp.]|nr:dTDP-4-amino-4,6-dideoxygalactose transaminase [Roseburia sp.]